MSEKKCYKTLCQTYQRKQNKKNDARWNKIYKNELKKNRQQLCEKNLTEKKRSELQEKIKSLQEWIKKTNTKKYHKKIDKISMNLCKYKWCNPTCRGTDFESEPFPSKEYYKRLSVLGFTKKKLSPFLVNITKTHRKKWTGSDGKMLHDGFYRGFLPQDVKFIRDKGGISGCATDLYPLNKVG